MKLIIRDDDISFFTRPEDLEHLYKSIWDDVPIHLAVIPCVKACGDEVPLEKRDGNFHSFNQNKKLVSALKQWVKEGKVVIWQHGLTHESVKGKHEMEWSDVVEPGQLSLNSTFKRFIPVFVAPHDRLSKKTIKAVEIQGMDVCRCFSPLPREFKFTKKYFKNFWEFSKLYLKHKTKYRFDYWMDYGGHKELYSYRINQITRENIDDIIERHKDGILCVVVHHRSLDLHGIEKLKYLIKRCDNV